MRGVFIIPFEKIVVTAAQDLLEVNSPADAVVEFLKGHVSQDSDAGDAEDEMLNVMFHRASTSGSGGAVVTPNPTEEGSAAFGGTAERNNTTQGTEGTIVPVECFNVRQGFDYVPLPEEKIYISPSGRLVMELQDAPADALTMSGYMVVREIGG